MRAGPSPPAAPHAAFRIHRIVLGLCFLWAALAYCAYSGLFGAGLERALRPFSMTPYDRWFRTLIAWGPLMVWLGGFLLSERLRTRAGR